MTDDTITEDTITEDTITEAVAPEATEEEPTTFSADYVAKLREENAAQRVKAKRVIAANARLSAAYAATDGRLVDVEAFAFSEDLLDDDGLVDRDKVATAISALIEAKPYLASRRPVTPIAQGVRTDIPAAPGLFDLIRERA